MIEAFLNSSALKINVTPITDGAAGGILFKKSDGKLGQSSNLHWDQTNSRLSIGQGTTPAARLDIRLSGVLSTDFGVRVRNSLNTEDLFVTRGNMAWALRGIFFEPNTQSVVATNFTANYVDTPLIRGGSGFGYLTVGAPSFGGQSDSGLGVNGGRAKLGIGVPVFNVNANEGSRVIAIANGTAPTVSYANAFQLYSETGQARFRNADGSIIKIFQGAALTVSDGTLTNAVIRIAELEARL